jgi:class 3 adenylate cyclase
VTLVGVALVSVLLLSGLNYLFARLLISDSVEAQLGSLRDTRVQAIERGAARIQAEVATIAVTPSVITAIEDLSNGYDDLDGDLSGRQLEELEAAYSAAFEPLQEIGRDVPVGAVLPTSEAGQFVQYEYILRNPNAFDDRDRLDDAGDGSAYSIAHAEHHPLLRSLMENIGASDLLLLDIDTTDVVYSVKKRIDVGTSAITGPWAEEGIGQVVDGLASATVGDTVISDTAFYVPARGQPVVFIATVIRSGSKVLGAVVAEIPVGTITDLATAGQDWDLLGLGETGEIYLVGSDNTLRTDTRDWLDDPEAFVQDHLDRLGDETAAAQMELAGSAALTVEVDNAAVDAALSGDTFVGRVTNYRGDGTFAASGPVRVGDQDWAVIVEQDRSEATAGLNTLLRSTLLVMAVLLPATALLGWWLARSLTRPFGQLVDAAGRIANGEPASDVGELGNNELGDVGRQLEIVASRLAAEEVAILDEEAQIDDVLGAVIPRRLVDRVRSGEKDITDLLDTATAIAFVVGGIPEATGSDQDTVYEITEHLTIELDTLVETFGVERVRRSTTNALFVAGMGRQDSHIADAAGFTAAVMALIESTGDEFGQALTIRAGLAVGDVASGVIGHQQLTFSVWGEPVSAAFTLASLARPGEILVDAVVREALVGDALGSQWQSEPRDGLPGLDDDIEAWTIRPSQPADA